MPKLPDLASGFKTLREVDLNAIRVQAEAPFHLAIIGDAGVGKSTLIAQLLAGPRASDPPGVRPVSEQRLQDSIALQPHSVALLVLDATRNEHPRERQVFQALRAAAPGAPVLVCYNKADLAPNPQAVLNEALHFPGSEVVAVSAEDRQSLLRELTPALLRVGRGREILLARHLPILRESVARALIDEACFTNAGYSLATGLAEINLVLDVPLNVADMVVLTKNQALMAYKIALAAGLPADWRETIPKLAAVVGSAFLWRQAARQLVGLIPAYGIVPKIAVSYAGTYAVGQAIYQWCAHGEKLRPAALRSLYTEALHRGRELAHRLVAKRRLPRLPAPKKPAARAWPGRRPSPRKRTG
ncbi:MAG: GTPase domain-containing protein [Chloroflexi bacterium]|nr:GTPase domain-containing protein [Chloroflexota bacterium]